MAAHYWFSRDLDDAIPRIPRVLAVSVRREGELPTLAAPQVSSGGREPQELSVVLRERRLDGVEGVWETFPSSGSTWWRATDRGSTRFSEGEGLPGSGALSCEQYARGELKRLGMANENMTFSGCSVTVRVEYDLGSSGIIGEWRTAVHCYFVPVVATSVGTWEMTGPGASIRVSFARFVGTWRLEEFWRFSRDIRIMETKAVVLSEAQAWEQFEGERAFAETEKGIDVRGDDIKLCYYVRAPYEPQVELTPTYRIGGVVSESEGLGSGERSGSMEEHAFVRYVNALNGNIMSTC